MGDEVNVIRARREELGLSQERLAKKARVSRISVQRAERGEASMETLSKVAHALNVPVDELTSAFTLQKRLPHLQALFRTRDLNKRELKGLPPDLRTAFEKCQKARTDLILQAIDVLAEQQRLDAIEEKRIKWRECVVAAFASPNEVTRANLLCATEALRTLPKPTEYIAVAPSSYEANLRWTAAQTLLELVSARYANSELNEEALPLGHGLLHPLRILREWRGLSQDGVALITDTGRATVQRFERGEHVAADTQRKILNALDVTTSELERILEMFREKARSCKLLTMNDLSSLDELDNLPAAVRRGWKELLRLRAELEDGMARFTEAQEVLNAKSDECFAAVGGFLECAIAALDNPNEDTFNAVVRAKDAMCTLPNDGLAAHIAMANAVRDRFFELMRRYAEAAATMEYALTGNVSLIQFASSSTGDQLRCTE